MNLRRTLMIIAAVCAIAIGSISAGLTGFAGTGTANACGEQNGATLRACSKCGDHVCVRQCGETATSCPVDCGGVPSGGGGAR